MTARFSLVMLLSIAAASCTPAENKKPPATMPATQKTERAGVAVYVGDELLTDSTPQPALVTKQTKIKKPKFDVIDIHCHWTLKQDPAALLKSMDELGETRAINLSG